MGADESSFSVCAQLAQVVWLSGGVARASYPGRFVTRQSVCVRKRKMAMTVNLHEPEFPATSHPHLEEAAM